MTEAELYKRSDEVLGSYLGSKGFRTAQPGEYVRRQSEGDDRILVSRGPSNKAKTHFAVFMSYYPDYMKIIDEVIPLAGEDRGFPCGPYLTPAGVMRREKYWSYKDSETLKKSLDHALQCLDQVGLSWLESLRNPQVFADNVDPVAALYAGLASEAAGNAQKAVGLYQEMHRRLREMIKIAPNLDYFIKRFGREFIFIVKKLGVENEKCDEFQRKLNYYPDIKQLA
jgi:hypothetical protein